MGKLLLKQDEMILLKNSEAVKNIETYGNMYDCVMPYKVLARLTFKKMNCLIQRQGLQF